MGIVLSTISRWPGRTIVKLRINRCLANVFDKCTIVLYIRVKSGSVSSSIWSTLAAFGKWRSSRIAPVRGTSRGWQVSASFMTD